MNRALCTTTIIAVFTLLAAEAGQAKNPKIKMEKCKIIGPDGKSLIKEHMTDCGGKASSCAGSNVDGDPEAWVYLPAGTCGKIKGGSLCN